MTSNRKLKAEEVALMVDVSLKTLNMWYMFKKQNPENEYSKMLPDFEQEYPRACRYWNYEDVWKIIEFKQSIPHGRNGILGNITQKWYRGKKANDNE